MRIGVDLGGTKIEAIALAESGAIAVRRRVPTPNNYDDAVRTIRDLVFAIDAEIGGRPTIGVGMPGALSTTTGLVKNANSTWLIGRKFDRDLAAALGRAVRLENDANCFALSEASDGAGAGAEIVFGVILGTGCGGGIVARGQILRGANAIAGEWGHNPLPAPRDEERPGPQCYCGRRGCIETYLSGPSLARDHGTGASAAEVAAAADTGDPLALATLERYAERLARSLAVVVNILDPDVIVLGGGVSRIARLYDSAPRHWTRSILSDTIATRLKPPAHGDSSGVRGAAWLWREGEEA